jgi:hypothetical protein
MSRISQEQQAKLSQIQDVLCDEMKAPPQKANPMKEMMHQMYLSLFMNGAKGYFAVINKIIEGQGSPELEASLVELAQDIDKNKSWVKSSRS